MKPILQMKGFQQSSDSYEVLVMLKRLFTKHPKRFMKGLTYDTGSWRTATRCCTMGGTTVLSAGAGTGFAADKLILRGLIANGEQEAIHRVNDGRNGRRRILKAIDWAIRNYSREAA